MMGSLLINFCCWETRVCSLKSVLVIFSFGSPVNTSRYRDIPTAI